MCGTTSENSLLEDELRSARYIWLIDEKGERSVGKMKFLLWLIDWWIDNFLNFLWRLYTNGKINLVIAVVGW